jgi:hypothetical protein
MEGLRLMAGATRRPTSRQVERASTRAPGTGELAARIDRLGRQVESLAELVRGQNELLRRLCLSAAQPTGAIEAPAARLPSDADPAGPSHREGYADLVIRIRALIRSVAPAGANVLVASKGDEELLLLENRKGWHFPQTDGGVYSGHHPLDSEDAIERLEQLRDRGADFFVLPSTAFWWLDHYPGFVDHLNRYRVALRSQDACLVFDLRSEEGGVA